MKRSRYKQRQQQQDSLLVAALCMLVLGTVLAVGYLSWLHYTHSMDVAVARLMFHVKQSQQ